MTAQMRDSGFSGLTATPKRERSPLVDEVRQLWQKTDDLEHHCEVLEKRIAVLEQDIHGDQPEPEEKIPMRRTGINT